MRKCWACGDRDAEYEFYSKNICVRCIDAGIDARTKAITSIRRKRLAKKKARKA